MYAGCVEPGVHGRSRPGWMPPVLFRPSQPRFWPVARSIRACSAVCRFGPFAPAFAGTCMPTGSGAEAVVLTTRATWTNSMSVAWTTAGSGMKVTSNL